MPTEEKNNAVKGVEVREENVSESVFIHLNM